MNLWPLTNIELQNYVNLLSYKLNKICGKLVFNGNKFEIILEYIKDLSVETPNVETLLFVKKNITKYKMNIDISSKALKDKMGNDLHALALNTVES